MPNLDPLPSPFESGKTISAKALNQIAQSAVRMISGVDGIDVKYYGDRVTIGRKDIGSVLPGSGNYLQQFVILQELDDVLVCTPYIQPSNGTGEGSAQVPLPFRYFAYANETNLVLVAKPYYLQKSPWDQRIISQSGQNYFITYSTPGVRTLNSVTIYASSTTFTQPNPPGDEAVTLLAIGGSGGGYGASTTIPMPGRGTDSILNYTLTNTHVYQITIGAGGAPGVAGGNSYVFDTTTGGPPAITGTGGSAGDPLIANIGSQGLVGIVHYNTETVQRITPAYLVGEVIVATRAVTGYYSTGLDKLGNPLPVLFMDANEAGRTWQNTIAASSFIGVSTTSDALLGSTGSFTFVGPVFSGFDVGHFIKSPYTGLTAPVDGFYMIGAIVDFRWGPAIIGNQTVTISSFAGGYFDTIAIPYVGQANGDIQIIDMTYMAFLGAGQLITFGINGNVSGNPIAVCWVYLISRL